MRPVFDMHCDTIHAIYRALQDENRVHGKVREKCEKNSLRENCYQVDLQKMKQGGYGLQCFAIYVNQEEHDTPVISAKKQIEIFQRKMEENSNDIRQIFTGADLLENEKAERMSALLTIEGGEACHGEIEKLHDYYEKGVRMMTLTWNYENDLAYPNHVRENVCETNLGLKEQGYIFIEEMERMGMMIDVSHLSDAGFFDVAAHTTRPFLATHSNARSKTDSVRNLTDEMIRIIADRGGVIGLNFCPHFLCSPGGKNREQSKISDMIRHVKQLYSVGGIECIGLGSDFDGIEGELEIKDCSQIYKLEDALVKAGFSALEIDRIFYKNVRRIIH